MNKSDNSVTKRVRIRTCYRESPAGERGDRDGCGRWLLRGVFEQNGTAKAVQAFSGRER